MKQDLERAFQLYCQVAEGNNAKGMNNLGACFLKGIGTPQNEKKAFEWFLKAAELGDSMAQNKLHHKSHHIKQKS